MKIETTLLDQLGADKGVGEETLALRPSVDIFDVGKHFIDSTNSTFGPCSSLAFRYLVEQDGLDESVDAQDLLVGIAFDEGVFA